MSNKGVNLEKIENMEKMAFHNALRLHNDSIILYNNRSFPSSFQLSVLSQEEFGKVHMLDDFIWHSYIDGRMGEHYETQWLGMTYNHLSKQNNFIRNADLILKKKFIHDVYSGKLEMAKQNATYVGLKRVKGKVQLKSRIHSPFAITKEKAKRQITSVNDHLLHLTLGTITETFSIDCEPINEILTLELYKEIKSKWKFIGGIAKNRLKKLEKYV
jgi:AbiV family abortive infection protein